jgi:hypothetical protein
LEVGQFPQQLLTRALLRVCGLLRFFCFLYELGQQGLAVLFLRHDFDLALLTTAADDLRDVVPHQFVVW